MISEQFHPRYEEGDDNIKAEPHHDASTTVRPDGDEKEKKEGKRTKGGDHKREKRDRELHRPIKAGSPKAGSQKVGPRKIGSQKPAAAPPPVARPSADDEARAAAALEVAAAAAAAAKRALKAAVRLDYPMPSAYTAVNK